MVRKCGKYSAYDLRSRIKIERKTQTADGQGGFTETWEEISRSWAKWMPLSGNETFQAMRVGSRVRVRAVVRFRGDQDGAPYYSAADRVQYKGRTYGIESVAPVEDANRFLELMLTESAPS